MLSALPKSLKTELYRKSVHLSSLWIPAFIVLAGKNLSIMLFAVLFLINLAVEYSAYQKSGVVGRLFRRTFIKTLRNKEVGRNHFVPSGSVYVLFAALVTSACYAPLAAAAAMSVMLISDTCAALVGKFLGSIRFYNGKSAEGTFAFWVSAFLVVNLFFPAAPLLLLFGASAAACLAEFFEAELKVDDNFAIPVVCGFLLNLLG